MICALLSLGCSKIFFHVTSVATQQGKWVSFQKKNMHLLQTKKKSFATRKHLVMGQVFLRLKTNYDYTRKEKYLYSQIFK